MQPNATPRTYARQGPPPPSSREDLALLQARLTGHHQHPAPDAPRHEWAAYLQRLGFVLCAIPPGGKGPRYKGWPEAGLPAAHWLECPHEGIGAILGLSRLVSLDLDDLPQSRALLAELGLDLDQLLTGAILVRGNRERLRAIFRQPEGLELGRKALAWPGQEPGAKPATLFELRGGPVQDVLPPTIHPGTGAPYEWVRAPWELPRLGTLPAELLELWTGWDRWKPTLESLCPWAKPAPAPVRSRTFDRPSGGESVIDRFNAAIDPAEILERNGYKPKGPNRWTAPTSSTGLAGVVRLPESGLVFTHHTSDPLADGHGHDAFSLFCTLEHAGDQRQAVKAAAELLGIERPAARNTGPGRAEDPPPSPEEWPEPQPLTSATRESLPYPLDALPEAIRAAVLEAQGFTQAPLAMVASSALATLSLTAQPLADVRRADRLEGPPGAYFLTEGGSGERKSTVDDLFSAPIRAWEQAQAQACAPDLRQYQADLAAWEAARAGLKERVKGNARAGKSTEEAARSLRLLEDRKPEPPRIPRLIYQDVTPEALAWSLAKGWPSAGLVSAEAGSIFGGHGMGKDSILRNLSLLNQLWDAAPITVDRRSSESFTARSARVSLNLMIQETALRDFLERSGTLARGSGFLARFLFAWPESTQGTRLYTPPPQDWPALSAYHARLRALLDQPLPLDQWGDLSPPVLNLSPQARQAWIGFHDALEAELGEGGELRAVCDVASKAADNAARLACLLHLYAHGPAGDIGEATFSQAARIVAWHLNESRRFFGEMALPPDLADAGRLDTWLVAHCRREALACLATREAQRMGPIRDRERLSQAVAVLEELDRARMVREGRQRNIYPHPQLLEA